MPYAALQRPSLALGILKSGLTKVGIPVKVLYPNWQWAEVLGLETYQALSESPAATLLGEWTFAQAALGHKGGENFLEQVAQRELPDFLREKLQQAALVARGRAADFLQSVTTQVLSLEPQIVGCSSTFQQNCASLGVLKRIKEQAPDIITIMGGANCDGAMGPQMLESFDWLDLAVSGEADLLFPRLCESLLSEGLERAKLPQGVTRQGQRGDPRLRATLAKMDEAPVPDYEDYFQTHGHSRLRRWVYPGLAVETSRGCWWGQKHHCTFCGLNGGGMAYRSKSPERVLAEFEELSSAYEVQQFGVVDNILDMKHIRTVLPSLEGKSYKFFYETKANLKRPQLEVLRRAGVLWIQPGIESLHDAVLDLMDKGNTAPMNVELLRHCKELGIRVDWSILCGFPGEDDAHYAEMAEWLPHIYHLEPPFGVFRIRYDRFSPYHSRPDDYGVKLKPYWTYEHCYPLEGRQLHDLAYFFEDDGPGPPGRRDEDSRPGLKALRECVKEWRTHMHESRLMIEDDGHRFRVHDSRPGALKSNYSLSKAQASVARICPYSTTQKTLRAQVPELNEAEFEGVLDHLCERGLVLRFGERLVNLMLSAPPTPALAYFPGGTVLTRT